MAALIGSVSTASGIQVPDHNAALQEQLNFWSQFADTNND